MNLYRVFPPPPEAFDLSASESRTAVAEHYGALGESSVRAVMVTNSSGDTIDPEGSSEGLSRGADRKLLGILREEADAVVVGASTIRQEPVPLPRSTPLIVLSARGDLRNHRLVSRAAPNERLIVAAPLESKNALEVALSSLTWEHLPWEPTDSAQTLVDAIRERTQGKHLLVEGGRITWEYFAPQTTELLISTTPPPENSHQGIPPWWPGTRAEWELRSLFTDDQRMLYYRHVLVTAARPGP